MTNNTSKEENKTDWEKRFNSYFAIRDENPVTFDVDGLKEFISSELKRQKEEVIKMLWNIHTDENDKQSESWNRSLDLAIFKLNNPNILDTLQKEQSNQKGVSKRK